MPPETTTKDALNIQQISPPIFPDGLSVRVFGGLIHLLFISLPRPNKPENVVIVGDIVCTPEFARQIAEQCVAVLKYMELPTDLDANRINAAYELLQASLVMSQEGTDETH
jgi:hypothetical protein